MVCRVFPGLGTLGSRSRGAGGRRAAQGRAPTRAFAVLSAARRKARQDAVKKIPEAHPGGRKWPGGHRVRKCCTCQSLRGRLLGFGRGGRQLVVTGASPEFCDSHRM